MTRLAATGTLLLAAAVTLGGQAPRKPTARLVSAPPIALPGQIDSNNPFVWDLVDGVPRLFVVTSWGGTPIQSSGSSLDHLERGERVTFTNYPGHGVWMESIVTDAVGTWYGYYHHERPADDCGRHDRELPRIGAARSRDHGRTWDDLGIVLDAPAGSARCQSTGRYVLGGVGDVSAMLDADGEHLYLFFSQYFGDVESQGVAVARMAWADRDEPIGKAAIFNDGAWLPITSVRTDEDGAVVDYAYPAGTPLHHATKPFHDGVPDADVFWGAAVHWNTYLERYVMLLNRAKDEDFETEGIYVSYAPTLDDPAAWSAPARLLSGGLWYPQVVGLEPGTGTDKQAGQRARFFLHGSSDRMIEFSAEGQDPPTHPAEWRPRSEPAFRTDGPSVF